MTTPTLESAIEAFTLFGTPSSEDLKICMSEIVPAVRKLVVDLGMPVNAIVEALAKATVLTCDPNALNRIFLIASE
jgi:hypothetical protein